jgi:acetate kinase
MGRRLANPCYDAATMSAGVLTINGGSSSIKFALYRADTPGLGRVLAGKVERIGEPGTELTATEEGRTPQRMPFGAGDVPRQLAQWLRDHLCDQRLAGVGHRVVHGGARLLEHQRVTPQVIDELKRAVPLDPAHLPREIELIQVLEQTFPRVPQVACFDTAFHRDLPRVARLMPVPRKYEALGVRRYGFHGLSFSFLLGQLAREGAAGGRVILAHLGAGASMAAVHDGRPVDTTMAFTPAAGLVMATRPGDLDPGLLLYLMQVDRLSVEEADALINHRCGLIGVSDTTADMRDLIAQRGTDVRAAEAVELFCYRARQWIGALAASMGGLDTLVFSGGIGEHSVEARAGICAGLEFLGVRLDERRNASSDRVISEDGAPLTVRVIPTDEEIVIARTTADLLDLKD